MTIAYIGIGANLGNAQQTVIDAITALADLPETHLVAASSLYLTAPVDAGGDDYVNAVACINTALDSQALLTCLQGIEQAHGRQRPYRNAPRTLDMDLLLSGSTMLDTPSLVIPHPRMHERAFVLVPLLEIAPGMTIPGKGDAAALLHHVADQRIRKIAQPSLADAGHA